MNEEMVPVFLMSGDEIGDVLYLPFTESEDGKSWTCSGSGELVVTHNIDRAVFESPIGCYEMPLYVRAKTHLTFEEGPGDSYLIPCHRPRSLAQTEQASVAH